MKKSIISSVLLIIVFVFTSCSSSRLNSNKDYGNEAKAPSQDASNQNESNSGDNDDEVKTPSKKSEEVECYWTIKVYDVQHGKITFPGLGTADAKITLDLEIDKDDGIDVKGNYRGMGRINVDLDMSKLENADVFYEGMNNWSRMCPDFRLTIEDYDSETYFSKIHKTVNVEPLRKFTSMGVSMSEWITWLESDVTVTEKDSSNTHDIGYDGDDSDEPGVVLGIHLRIEGATVMVEIPTYTMTFEGVGYFTGTVTGEPHEFVER